MGQIYGGSLGAAERGGSWQFQEAGGIYATILLVGTGLVSASASRGFRCVYNP